MIYHYIIRRSETPYAEGMVGFMVDQGASRLVYLEANEEQSTVLCLKYKSVQQLHSTLEQAWNSWNIRGQENPFRKSKSDLPAETTNLNSNPA